MTECKKANSFWSNMKYKPRDVLTADEIPFLRR